MGEPTKPDATADGKPTQTAPAATTQTGDDGKGGKAAVLADLATERDKRQELEQQVQTLTKAQQAQTDALAKAFGIKPEETSDTSALAAQVTTLQEQFAQTQHQNAVLSVANEHGITDKDDLTLLTSVKDEATMRTLAARIQKASETPGTPKPDRTQGGSGGEPTGSSSPEQDFATFLSGQLSR